MLDNAHLFTVTDLKQHEYCPRVIFYERCLPHVRPRTYKMDAGRDEHEAEQMRAHRRSLSQYALTGGKRAFDVRLTSHKLALTGCLDEVVEADTGEIFPVDYKMAKKVSSNHRLQLAAYGLLLEEARTQPIKRGFIYLIPPRKMVEVKFTEALKAEVYQTLTALEAMIRDEAMPAATSQRSRCYDCEFRRFCNDV